MWSATSVLQDAATGTADGADAFLPTDGQDVERGLRAEYQFLCRSRDELIALKEQYSYLLDAAPIAYMTTNSAGQIVHANQRALLTLGLRAEELIGLPTVNLAEPKHRHALASHLANTNRFGESELELELRVGQDVRLPVLLRSIPVSLGLEQDAAVQTAIIDISALKHAEDRLRRARDELQVLARHDTLTGLPNRALFLERLTAAKNSASRTGCLHALLFLDMDRFKVINDSLGHDVGDSLLQQVAHLLAANVRGHDTVARMGGDEFTIILNDVGNAENAVAIAQKLRGTINRPISLGGHRFRPSSSIGLCLFDGGEYGERELMRMADKAMYSAKHKGGNCVHVHDPTERDDGRSTLERELQFALERGQLALRFQPQYATDGRLVAHEALLRWYHPDLGHVAPSRFVPLAEQSNLIREIGAWVLEEACRRNIEHAREHGTLTRIAVNVSPRELDCPDYAKTVRRVLDRTGHPPEALELEITETSMNLAEEPLGATLAELTDLGVSIALDDFGTGYSSFTRLRALPITRLKVDRSFTKALCESEGDRRIIAAIVSLGKELGLEVVAEGVETEYQLSFLRDSGCTVFQGYAFARPLESMAPC
jgi:diguanylate cyclase (GGDEF)-like protein/PAS domain S-box-containing protein